MERRDLWHDLLSFSPSISWCMLGDFNVIKDLAETNIENVSWDIGMEEFRSCTTLVGVDDIKGFGPLFTWSNMQLARPVHKKQDRAMGNSDWFSNFSMSLVTYAPRGLSDHSLLLLRTGIRLPQPKRQFQFFNHMLLLEGFNEVVGNAWSTSISGNPFHVFSEKLKLTRHALVSLNTTSGNVVTLVSSAKEELHVVQTLLHANPLDLDLLEREKSSHHLLWIALEREEMFLQQKSRANWLALGDHNSNYFANLMKNRWNSNKILSMLNSAGSLVHGQKNIEEVAVGYFDHLFNSVEESYPGFENYDILPSK